jgi:hypothetical protein
VRRRHVLNTQPQVDHPFHKRPGDNGTSWIFGKRHGRAFGDSPLNPLHPMAGQCIVLLKGVAACVATDSRASPQSAGHDHARHIKCSSRIVAPPECRFDPVGAHVLEFVESRPWVG